ncbi:MAG TPA: hypothetical protein VFS67_01665 [Polyangiaceae bacterium]|nr:hypothetical protein [Polyangiaceae bacterium]
MSALDRRRVTSLDELRALQRAEHAPAALRRRVLERLAAPADGAVAPHSGSPSAGNPLAGNPAAARSALRRSAGWFALGALAAALPFALWQRSEPPPGAEPELTLAAEPDEPASSGFEANAGARASRTGAAASRSSPPPAETAAVARLAAPTLPAARSSIGHPAPDTQPALRRDLPARRMVLPGFAPPARWTMKEGPLPHPIGPNLVTNGDFSHGTALWSVRRWDDFVAQVPSALARYDVVEGALCTTLPSGAFVLGGWPWDDRSLSPNSFALQRGQRYRVSLRAWIKGPLQVALVFKVGHQEPPYDAALVAGVPVTQLQRRFSIAFEPHADDDNAGVGFVANAVADPALPFAASDLCIDDVTLTREARPL